MSEAPTRLPRAGRFQELVRRTGDEKCEEAAGTITFSLMSWNVLAPIFVEDGRASYDHVAPTVLDWNFRLELLVTEIAEAQPEILFLQEVMFTAYEEDLLPRLASLGYAGVMQDDKNRAEGHKTGNATFFAEDKFELCWEEHRSRVLLLGLRHKANGLELTTVNAHLEGDPEQPMLRVKQAKSALQWAVRKGAKKGQPLPPLVLAGDFNAPLNSSALASYLAFGKVLPGITEFGREVLGTPLHADATGSRHGYEVLQSAYPPAAEDFSFTLTGASGFWGMLDQIWFDTAGLKCLAIREPFRSLQHREEVLLRGLPSSMDPSDHLPVGAIFQVVPKKLTPDATAPPTSPEEEARLARLEAEALWQNCELSDAERERWEALEREVAAATPGQGVKPSAAALAALKAAQAAREAFVQALPDASRSQLESFRSLLRRAQKAEDKARKQSAQEARGKSGAQRAKEPDAA